MTYYKNEGILADFSDLEIDGEIITFKTRYGQHSVRKTHASFIHDFTIRPDMRQTDRRIEDKTPDVITDSEIFEYSTTMSVNKNVMRDKMENKIAKYQDIADKHDLSLIVIIVSRESVMSNVEIEANICDELIERMNIACSVRDSIFEKFNLNLWYSEDKTRFERILNVVLEQAVVIEPQNDFENSLNKELGHMSKEDYEYFKNECLNAMVNFSLDKKDYTKDIKINGTRFDYKRVVPVSFIIPESYDARLDQRVDLLCLSLTEDDLQDHQLSLICIAQNSVKIEHNKENEYNVAIGLSEVPEKRKKSMYRFKCDISHDQRIEMAMYGVQAKRMLSHSGEDIKVKRKKDKESFSLNSPTDDIESFISSDFLTEYKGFKVRDFSLEAYREWSIGLRTFKYENRKAATFNEEMVSRVYKQISSSTLIQYCKFLQALFTEINLSVRENLNEDVFIVKPIPGYFCDVYLKIIGSNKPIFFFIVAKSAFKFAQQTVGVKYKTVSEGDHIVSEWSSVKLRDVENYLAISSKMISSVAYLKQINTSDKIVSQHSNFLLLLLLSNKDRDEEIVTLLRFIYMRSLSLTDNVTTLSSKLPSCLRSRLNVYQVNKTISLMSYLFKNKPKIEMINKDRDVEGLIDIFGNSINFKQALNFCYYGYIVNKTKQTENNQSSKLIDKILEYDFKVDDGSKLSGVNKEQLDDHYHDSRFLNVICHLAELKVMQTYGENYKKHFLNDFTSYMSKQNLISLSTIKASAKTDLPDKIEGDCMEKLKRRRPKVTESLKNLCDEFGDFEHPVELVNFCIAKLRDTDSFNVELFSKDQHAGIREIYVVDIKVRVIQWFLESVSRCLCRLFDSETMTNPTMKDVTSQRMTRNAILKLNDPVMLCRSGDASKWSQTQNVTKFYQVLVKFLPNEFHQIIKSILMLWYRKKIFLPASLIDACMNFQGELENESINFVRGVFSGKIVSERLEVNKPYLRIRTGFMQGILHFTSSFFHTIVQEAFSVFKIMLVKNLFPQKKNDEEQFYNIILQGSDDNSESMIISKTLFRKCPTFFKILVQLKDIMSPYVGIKVSKEKTASCVPFLMEYNSTWELAGKFVMPTIKFVFVATDIPQKQTLIGRQEYYYSLLTNCLEKGATIFTCNLIRLAQADQHYLQLGFIHNLLFDDFFRHLNVNKSPALGYFMFEPTVITSLIGFDFMLYFHSIETVFSKYIKQEEKEIPVQILSNLGYKSIADYTVSKFQFNRYDEIIKSLNLGDVEMSRERVNLRPEILYTNINDKSLELDLINLKMHDFSVKESLSSRFSKSEMFSSLVYILSRPVCYFNKEKNSLMKLCIDLNESTELNLLSRLKIKQSFSRSKQYDKIIDEVRPMINTNSLLNKTYIQRGSSRIKLLDGLNDDSYKLLDLCKAKWFHIKTLPISERVLQTYFKEAQSMIPWLKNTEFETREFLGCDSFQLYYYLLNSFKDSKFIKLLDTPGRRGNLKYLISRIADIDKKLVYNPSSKFEEKEYQKSIKSNIKFICDFPFEDSFKKKVLFDLLSKMSDNDLRNDERQVVTLVKNLLTNNSHAFQNNIIKFQNDLNLALFIKPQVFDENEGKWKGDGVLLSKSGPLIYELKFNNSDVVKIAVNDLNLARSKFPVILKTINDLNFKLILEGDESLRLNASGIHLDRFGTEIEEQKDISFNLSNLRNLSVTIEHERIKIVTRMTSEELNKRSFMDDLPTVDMVQVESPETKEKIWIKKGKNRKGSKVLATCKMSESKATQYITVCSIKTRHFNFNNQHKPLFELNSFAKLFWKQEQDTNLILIKINKIIEKLKITGYKDFCSKLNLSLDACLVFRDLLLGKFKSRDELVRQLDTNDVLEEAEWNMNTLLEMHNPDSHDMLINQISAEGLLPALEKMDDSLMNYAITNEQITDFAESLSRSSKGFYLHYSTNDVLDTKVFETFLVKIKNKIDDPTKLFQKDPDVSRFDTFTKNMLICLFGVDLKINFNKEHCIEKNEKTNVENIESLIEDPDLLKQHLDENNALNNYGLDKIVLVEDTLSHLDEIMASVRKEIDLLNENYLKQRSIPMKNRTKNRIETYEDYISNLEKIRPSIVESIKPKSVSSLGFRLGMGADKHYSIAKLTEISNPLEVVNLHPELLELKFRVYQVPGDGGCLFYSLLYSILPIDDGLFITMLYDLREKIVNLINKFERNELIILKQDNGDDWPERLLDLSTYGDNYCMMAFGVLTNSYVHVRKDGVWSMTLGCEPEFKSHDIYIEHVGGNHFNSLILEDDYDEFLELKDVMFEMYEPPKYGV